MVNRYVSDPSFCAVSADNEDGGRRVAAFLLAGGHQRLAFIAGVADASTSVDRERGFFEGAVEAGTRHPLRAEGHFTYDGGRAAAVDLMQSASPPDAIFCASDIMAMGAMDAIRYELGLRVPEDVSVVGFINSAEAAWNSYRLTTVSVDVELMCRKSVAMLAELMDDPRPRTSPGPHPRRPHLAQLGAHSPGLRAMGRAGRARRHGRRMIRFPERCRTLAMPWRPFDRDASQPVG